MIELQSNPSPIVCDVASSLNDVCVCVLLCACSEPLDPPENFRLLGEPYNGTFAEFAWDSVDTSPERVQGFFRGYRVSRRVNFITKIENYLHIDTHVEKLTDSKKEMRFFSIYDEK